MERFDVRNQCLRLFTGAVVFLLSGCAVLQEKPVDPALVGVCESPVALSSRGTAREVRAWRGLASQRFLASLADEFARDWVDAQWQAWIARLRALAVHDGSAKGGKPLVDDCAKAYWQRSSEADLMSLVAATQIPSEYSALQKIAGVYPLSAQGLRLGVGAYQRATQGEWDAFTGLAPLSQFALPPVSTSRPVTIAAQLRHARRDALGIPILSESLLQQMAVNFAPKIYVQQQSQDDRPGVPTLRSNTVGVDTNRPLLTWRLDFTYVDGAVLPQISWIVWFDRRTPEGSRDPYAGALDGLVWRTTFGQDGWPLVYDSIHPCGCYHMVFPTRHEAIKQQGGLWTEARLQPLSQTPWAQVALVVDSGAHFLRAVLPADAKVEFNDSATLALEDWQSTRIRFESALRDDGVIRGTERLERYWLWPSGVRSPGAMRDWGRHATAFIGEQHFDDFRVLESYVMPGVTRYGMKGSIIEP